MIEDQFKLVTGKLPPPPQPSELSKVRLQDGVLHELIERIKISEEEEDVEMKEEESEETKRRKVLEDLTREDGPPSVVHLLTRQLHEFELKK